MSWPESDPYMHELRRKWDEGHFRQDAASVYGIDEAIDEAIEEITKNDNLPRGFGEGQTLTGTVPSIGVFNPFLGRTVDHSFAQELANGMVDDIERQFGEKTCRMCYLTAHNDPCDVCYCALRSALNPGSGQRLCVVCGGKTYALICLKCERIYDG